MEEEVEALRDIISELGAKLIIARKALEAINEVESLGDFEGYLRPIISEALIRTSVDSEEKAGEA